MVLKMKSKIFIGIMVIIVGGFSLAYKYNRTTFVITQVILHNCIYSSTKFEVKENKVYMDGYICKFTLNQLKKIVEKNPKVDTLVFKKVNGSLDDDTNFVLGRYIRKKGLTTYLMKTSSVSSGGTDLFLSGKERIMEKGAFLGVHSWESIGTNNNTLEAKDIPRDSEKHKANATYIKDMLGSEDFYWYTIYAAPANGMHRMTEGEIKKYNAATKVINI